MPSNLLIFDADYVSELTSRMNTACELMSEAVSSLKSASSHENWKCKERTRILGDFDELNVKLGRLDGGVNETTRILGGSVSRFAALESQYDSQAENLSEELTSNHGYAATVRTEGAGGQTVQPSQSGQTAQNAEPGTSTETGSARPEAAASTSTDQESAGQEAAGPGRGGHGAAAASAMAGQVAGRGRHGQAEAEHGSPANSGGESQAAGGATMNVNVNLPVTHIPDNPEAAARGTKDTREVAEAAVSMTVHTITLAFTGDAVPNAEELAEAYNAGRSIFENGAIIIGSPMQVHTTERLAMAAGIVSLAGNSSAGIGRAVSTAASFSSSSSGGNIRTKAKNLMSAFQGNSQADELRNLLGIMAGSSSESVAASSSGGGKSFFEMIVEELKKAISGENSGGSSSSLFSSSSSSSSSSTSSLSESSPVMEFLNNFVMDQV